MFARVSWIDAFRRWREDEESSVEDLVRDITSDEPSEAMLAGTAFHRAIEIAPEGEHDMFEANGYTFRLLGGGVALPAIREIRGQRQYGGLTVSGQVDGIFGRMVVDHKTTKRVDLERYVSGAQWKFYLDIFGADVFRWHVFEIKETAPLEYDVAPPQSLTVYRYPGLHDYCARLADDYLDFASRHMPRAA